MPGSWALTIAAPTVAPRSPQSPRSTAGVGKAAKVAQDGDIALVAWSRAWIGEVDPLDEVVAESSPEIAAVGPREVQACVGDGGLAKSC